jgi:hypothetical protein
MKVTNKSLVDSIAALNELVELSLPIKLSFKIAKVTKQVQPLVDAYNQVLSKLQVEHSETEDDGKPKMIDTDDPNIKRFVFKDTNSFYAAHQELLGLENELDMDKVSVEEFGELDVKPSLLFTLSWFIDGLE